jgi:hypothetical protein
MDVQRDSPDCARLQEKGAAALFATPRTANLSLYLGMTFVRPPTVTTEMTSGSSAAELSKAR